MRREKDGEAEREEKEGDEEVDDEEEEEDEEDDEEDAKLSGVEGRMLLLLFRLLLVCRS